MLIIDPRALEDLKQHCRGGFPEERCGLLVGRWERGTSTRLVQEAHRAGNLNKERAADRYELDAKDHLKIDSEARKRNLEIVGVYHSHPDHPSVPSETDRSRAEMVWEEFESWSYVIVEVANGVPASWRSWILKDRNFKEEEIRVEDPV